MYLQYSQNTQCNPTVRVIQEKLNKINNGRGNTLVVDGIFGVNTKRAVMEYQKCRGIIPVTGIVGDTTYGYLMNESTNFLVKPSLSEPRLSGSVAMNVYGVTKKSIKVGTDVFGLVDNICANLKRHEQAIDRIMRYVSNNKLGMRKLKLCISQSIEVLKHVQKFGVASAITKFGAKINRKNVLDFLKEMSNLIRNSKVTITLNKIRKALKPLDSIPGLKYIGAIEGLAMGTIQLFKGNYKEALSCYLDALRDIVESIAVDLAVAALFASGLGILAIVLVAVVFIIDYFLFSDNAGDSLIDKHTDLKTVNLVRDTIAPAMYEWLYE